VQFLIAGPDLKLLEDFSAKDLEKMKTIPGRGGRRYDSDQR
jgi:hypothetical protein